jgi:hypothetical protein
MRPLLPSKVTRIVLENIEAHYFGSFDFKNPVFGSSYKIHSRMINGKVLTIKTLETWPK